MVHVNDFRGKKPFKLYIVKDNNPTYKKRYTSKGNRLVNIKLFDLKKELRKIVGGCRIHATDNIQETKHNLKSLGLFQKYYKQKKFNNLEEVFNELNNHTKLNWLITHNFDPFIKNDDIDFSY